MAYIDRNLAIASRLNRKNWKHAWQINKSFLLSATCLLKEAEDALNEVPRQELSDADLLTGYFGQMMYLWSHFGQYTGSQSEEVQRSYLDKERMYRDSVYQVVRPSHPLYLWYKGCYYQYQGEEAMRQVVSELREALDGKEWDNRYDA